MSIMGELDRHSLINREAKTVINKSMGQVIKENALNNANISEKVKKRALAAPGAKRNLEGYSQNNYFKESDLDRSQGCIRDFKHAYSQDGGLAVLFGNIAKNGAIIKTAGVDESILKFRGTVRVFDSQEQAVEAILADKIKAGEIVVIRYEGPKGGPGMQEMLYPTTYLKSKKLDKDCALLTDGRFSGGTSGLSIGHVSPEAALGGEIGLLEDGDVVEIDIPQRSINLLLTESKIAERRSLKESKGGFYPKRIREVSYALKQYAIFATSADKGAVKDKSLIDQYFNKNTQDKSKQNF
jgi:dihydroxy-acid dehydratase